ncbi:MAG: NHL repeat-containing protein, partial [Actinomycetota bacterium]
MGRDAALARPGAARAAVRLVLLGALTAAVLVPAGRAATPAEAWSASGTTVAGQPPSWGSGAAQLYRPESAVVDGSGNTYVADAFNHRIQRWAPGATSGVTVVGGNDCGPAANQLCYPSGVAFDGSGNLFVADTGNLRVQRFAPAGAAFATSGTTVAGGNGWGTNDNQFKAPWSVALDSVGNLYVSDSNNQRVQKFGWDSFNLTFSVGGLTIMGGNGAGSGANQLSYPRGLAIDSFGSVYVADESNGRIQRRTGDGTVTTVAGVSGYSGNTATYLSYPRGVAVDSSLNLYVGDTLNNRVQKFTWTGSSYGASPPVGTTVAGGNGSGTAANQLIGPRGVAVDSSGALFVTDFDSARVQRFAAGSTSSTNATTVAGSSPSWGAGAGQLWDPQGSAVDGSGNLFVADASNHRVQRWAPGATSGTTVAGGNGYGSGANQLAYPTGVALDGSGNLYVADFLNHRVQRFAWNGSSYSTSGTTVAGTGGAGGGTDQLFYPFAVAFDAGGNLYVSDGANARVQQFAWNGSTFATSGTSVAGGGTEGSGANQLSSPRGIALDATGNLFVADQGNARVQKFARSGSTFASSGTTVAGGNGPGLDPNQLSSPGGVAVDGMGNLYVADTYNDRVQRWAPSATSGTTLVGAAGPGSGANQLTRPWAVTLDVAGNLVVTDTENYRVQRWAGNPEAPTIGTVTPSGTSASVAFTPGDPGGAAPKYGGVCTSTNGGTARLTADAALTTSSPAPVVDLTPGGVYTCAAFAVNSAGTSSGSSASASFTVRPAAPTLGVVTPSGTSASVAFTPATGIGAGTSFTATCASSNGGTTRATSGS